MHNDLSQFPDREAEAVKVEAACQGHPNTRQLPLGFFL